jgi:hypothetical protein
MKKIVIRYSALLIICVVLAGCQSVPKPTYDPLQDREEAPACKIVEYDTAIRQVGARDAQRLVVEILDGPKKGRRYMLHIQPLADNAELVGRQYFLKLSIRSFELVPDSKKIWGFKEVFSETATKVMPIAIVNREFWEWYQKQNKAPNQALEPTSTAVTPPAIAGDRASGTRGSP